MARPDYRLPPPRRQLRLAVGACDSADRTFAALVLNQPTVDRCRALPSRLNNHHATRPANERKDRRHDEDDLHGMGGGTI
jgi:hypothetical protein